MEPRPIDLNDYILSGGGFMGESYNCKDNPDFMLKLYPLERLSLAQNDKLLRFIADIPDADTAVHGDLHFGNAILRSNKSWFIDIGEFGYGNPLFDLGIFMSVIKYTAEDLIRKLYHMEKSTAVSFWNAFLRDYFGADRPLKDIEEEIKPYAALRALFVQHEIGRLPPERQELVKCIIG